MPRAFVVFFVAFLAAASSLLACSGSGGGSRIPPQTGIVIRAESLTAGRGCGRDVSQVFKYAAIVFGFGGGDPGSPAAYTVPVTGNVFDCFADATFLDLPEQNGSVTYRLEVFAYNAEAFARSSVSASPADAALLRESAPTWTTQCQASQRRDVQAVAACKPLGIGLSGLGQPADGASVVLATGEFALEDGGVLTCDQTDGGVSTDAGEDADGGDADASADASRPPATGQYRVVRVVYSGGNASGSEDVRCPLPFRLDGAVVPASYTLDVTLLADDVVLGKAACEAETSPGTESSAKCGPVR